MCVQFASYLAAGAEGPPDLQESEAGEEEGARVEVHREKDDPHADEDHRQVFPQKHLGDAP